MENWWKQFGAWVTALKNRVHPDIFARARLKIVLLYLLMGVIILGIGGYLVYVRMLAIIQDVLLLVQQMLTNPANFNQNNIAVLITHALTGEIEKMNIIVGLWLVLTMIIAAYILADITLRPIKRAMERQERFIGNVSHELRTPLSVMKTNSEVAFLGDGDASAEELKEIVKNNLEEINRMSRIMQFLLNFSIASDPSLRLSFSTINLNDVVGTTMKSMRTLAERKEIKLEFKARDDAWIKGDTTAIDEIVTNLVKNAIAYTPPQGSVTVAITRKAYGAFVLSVQDTGIGIPSEDVPHIFESFYRGKNAYSQRSKKRGVGIGLAIVREMVRLHNATISVESTLGEGTTFTVTFPVLIKPR